MMDKWSLTEGKWESCNTFVVEELKWLHLLEGHHMNKKFGFVPFFSVATLSSPLLLFLQIDCPVIPRRTSCNLITFCVKASVRQITDFRPVFWPFQALSSTRLVCFCIFGSRQVYREKTLLLSINCKKLKLKLFPKKEAAQIHQISVLLFLSFCNVVSSPFCLLIFLAFLGRRTCYRPCIFCIFIGPESDHWQCLSVTD